MKTVLVSLLSCLFVASCTTGPVLDEGYAQPLTEEVAREFALYAMMSANAYRSPADSMYFPLESLGWIRIDESGASIGSDQQSSYSPSTPIGRLLSNLQFDIWRNGDSDTTVFAFRGTDKRPDWLQNLSLGISIQYKSAKKRVRQYFDQFCDSDDKSCIELTGHSLGGGLALSVSLWQGHKAVVFDSSPRLFDGLGDNEEPAERDAVFQAGDIVSKMAELWPKYRNRVVDGNIRVTEANFKFEPEHAIIPLAEGILRCASGASEFARVLRAFDAKLSVDHEKIECPFPISE